MSADTELLPLDQIADRLGWQGTARKHGPTPRAKRLRELLEERERETGRTFLTRYAGGKRTTLRVSMAAVKEAAPELFPGPRQNLAKRWQRMLRNLDERIEERVAPVERRLDQVDRDGHVTREMIVVLAEKLGQSLRQPEAPPTPAEREATDTEEGALVWGEE